MELGLELPGVEQSLWYRTPSLAVGGRSFVRLAEDGHTVVFLLEVIDEKEALIAANPDLYYTTDHYRKSAAILARLPRLRVGEARERLEEAWRRRAPKGLLEELDGE